MIYAIAVLLLVLFLMISFNIYQSRTKRSKLLLQIRNRWGKPVDEYRNVDSIASYLKATSTADDLPESAVQDLDTEGLFAYLDRTSSKPGQQYLYKKLHQPETDLEKLQQLDANVEKLAASRALQEEIELELSALNQNNAYYLHKLFTTEHQQPFSRALSFYISVSGITIMVLAGLLFWSVNQFYFLLLLGMLIANLIIHYQCKNKIYAYTHSLPQLLVLIKVASRLVKKVDLRTGQPTSSSMENMLKLKRSLGFISFESRVAADQTDIIYAFWELIKMLLLLEPFMFIVSIKSINKYREDIAEIFNYVASVDMLISIQSVRVGLPYYCKPVFNKASAINVQALYHPLVPDCVPNSLVTDAGSGVLITGSNMSGKTTFIRAMAINALLSQSLFTSCSSSYQAPLLKLHTSIRISDDLHEQKSYFKAEALSIRNIIESCEQAKPLKSLVIIDEIFRGTNTIERIAAAKAVLAYLTHGQNFVMVSTHDLELAELLGNDYSVYSFEETVADTRLVFDYLMKPGLLKNKNGIAILKALGYPETLVHDAGKVSDLLKQKYQLL